MSFPDSIALWLEQNNADYWHWILLASIWGLIATSLFLTSRVNRLEDEVNSLLNRVGDLEVPDISNRPEAK